MHEKLKYLEPDSKLCQTSKKKSRVRDRANTKDLASWKGPTLNIVVDRRSRINWGKVLVKERKKTVHVLPLGGSLASAKK